MQEIKKLVSCSHPFFLVFHENFFECHDIIRPPVSGFENLTECSLTDFSHFFVFADIVTERKLQLVHEFLSVSRVHWSYTRHFVAAIEYIDEYFSFPDGATHQRTRNRATLVNVLCH